MPNPIQHEAGCGFPQLRGRLTDGCNRHCKQRSEFEVIKSDDRNFLRHIDPFLLQSSQNLDSSNVVERKQGGWWFCCTKPLHNLGAHRRYFVNDDELRLQARLRHRLFVSAHSLTDGVELAVIRYTKNRPMSVLKQMLHRSLRPLVVFHHHL